MEAFALALTRVSGVCLIHYREKLVIGPVQRLKLLIPGSIAVGGRLGARRLFMESDKNAVIWSFWRVFLRFEEGCRVRDDQAREITISLSLGCAGGPQLARLRCRLGVESL